MSDVRGSADYRRTLCRNILLKLWHDLQDPAAGDAIDRRFGNPPPEDHGDRYTAIAVAPASGGVTSNGHAEVS